jgi:hypothetical protein
MPISQENKFLWISLDLLEDKNPSKPKKGNDTWKPIITNQKPNVDG